MGRIFISHSYDDIDLVKNLVFFLSSLCISISNIFCSSIEGHGLKNGERITSITKEIEESDLIIYCITDNFIHSSDCHLELGAARLLDDNIFIFKTENVSNNIVNSIIARDYKANAFDFEGVNALIDKIKDVLDLQISMGAHSSPIQSFLSNLQTDIGFLNSCNVRFVQKDITDMFETEYNNFALKEKKILARLYFSTEPIDYHSFEDGLINFLEIKGFILRLTKISDFGFSVVLVIHPSIREFLNNNKIKRYELLSIYKRYFY